MRTARTGTTSRPRLTQALVAFVLVAQAVFAWAGIAPDGDPLAGSATTGLLETLVVVGFAVYALAVAAFVVGVVIRARWLRALGIGIGLGGIALALLRLATAELFDALVFGMGIDALIVYGLRRPDIRPLFPA
jgi:hypothetical protein